MIESLHLLKCLDDGGLVPKYLLRDGAVHKQLFLSHFGYLILPRFEQEDSHYGIRDC
jgi:hypothetical protein